MNEWITIQQVAKAEGIELNPSDAWSIGSTIAALYLEKVGHLPIKELRPKTYGSGTHCLAVYPPAWKDAILEAITLHVKDDQRQPQLWSESSAEDFTVRTAGYELQRICHSLARDAGWWQDASGSDQTYTYSPGSKNPAGRNLGEMLCLIHSEISEAMEGARKGLYDDKLPHRPMLEVELADAVIRIFDMAGGLNMDLPGAIADKLRYNAQRADHKPENRSKPGGKSF